MIKTITTLSIIGLMVITVSVFAVQDYDNMNLKTPGVDKNLILPLPATNSSVIFLGIAYDPGSNSMVEGYAIIHYAKGGKKGPPEGKNGKGKQCYTFISKGAKWKDVEDYMVDTTGSGLADAFVRTNIASNIDKWEEAAVLNILGNEIVGLVDGADTISPDDKNEVLFGPLDQGTIGVTIIWGIFGGRPAARKLVEWDQVYNTFYQWSENGETGKMDFENIATHELGHSFGLGDLYDANCMEETMYGYATEGETKKRDLGVGDIAGIIDLYK